VSGGVPLGVPPQGRPPIAPRKGASPVFIALVTVLGIIGLFLLAAMALGECNLTHTMTN
jgi:hypothetical protein